MLDDLIQLNALLSSAKKLWIFNRVFEPRMFL